MASANAIPGITRGPEFESEKLEAAHGDRVVKEAKQGHGMEPNETLINAAVDSIEKTGNMFGRKLEVQYDTNSGMVVFTVYTEEGKMIRRIPPEEAIRMAARQADTRSQYLNEIM